MSQFEALVPNNFEAIMVDWWQEEESLTRDDALAAYHNDSFKALVDRVAGKRCKFKLDLGCGWDGGTCFEVLDNNFVIPVSILKSIVMTNEESIT